MAGAAGSAAAGVAGSLVAGVAGSVVAGVAGHVASSVVGVGVSAVFDAAGQWVASGAVWLLREVGRAMSSTTTVDLSSGWFASRESVMATIAAAVVLPLLCGATLQALYRQSGSMLARAFLVQLPLSLLLTGVAVELVQMALAVTDALSAQLMASAGVDTANILTPVSEFLLRVGVIAPPVPAFVVFVSGLLVAIAALGLWLELVVRAAAVSVAVLFLPLALAALVWPAVAHWCRRLTDTLVALVLSKLVIAAVLSLAVGALAGGFGVGPAGGDGGGGFAAVITGIALLLIATLAPFTLLRLVPAVEAGAVAHLEASRHRLSAAARAPVRAGNLAVDVARQAFSGDGTAGARGVGSTAPFVPMVAGTALPPALAASFGAAASDSGGSHSAGSHSAGSHSAGSHSAGSHGVASHSPGSHGAGSTGAGSHRAGTGSTDPVSTVRTSDGPSPPRTRSSDGAIDDTGG